MKLLISCVICTVQIEKKKWQKYYESTRNLYINSLRQLMQLSHHSTKIAPLVLVDDLKHAIFFVGDFRQVIGETGFRHQ